MKSWPCTVPSSASFVENETEDINIAVWDESNQEAPLGKCTTTIPLGPNYNQKMNTEWLNLTTPTGKLGGRIRLGIQYIYDQVKLLDIVMEKREEEHRILLKDLEDTQNGLDVTSAPFELLINPDKKPSARDYDGATPFDGALEKLATAFSGRIGSAEDYVVNTVKDLPQPGMKWGKLAQIGTGAYCLLSLIIAFVNEQFINVFLSKQK